MTLDKPTRLIPPLASGISGTRYRAGWLFRLAVHCSLAVAPCPAVVRCGVRRARPRLRLRRYQRTDYPLHVRVLSGQGFGSARSISKHCVHRWAGSVKRTGRLGGYSPRCSTSPLSTHRTSAGAGLSSGWSPTRSPHALLEVTGRDGRVEVRLFVGREERKDWRRLVEGIRS